MQNNGIEVLDDAAHFVIDERIIDDPIFPARIDEAFHPKPGKLLRDGGLRHGQDLFQFGNRLFPLRQDVQDQQPRFVRQRLEKVAGLARLLQETISFFRVGQNGQIGEVYHSRQFPTEAFKEGASNVVAGKAAAVFNALSFSFRRFVFQLLQHLSQSRPEKLIPRIPAHPGQSPPVLHKNESGRESVAGNSRKILGPRVIYIHATQRRYSSFHGAWHRPERSRR